MIKSKFIKQIVDKNGKVIYKNEVKSYPVFSKGTSSLMNEMLIEVSKSGTGKKLKDFKFDIATKTGTNGTTKGNTDAYAVSYTSEHTLAVWLGDKENKKLNITGGNECCKIIKEILEKLYSDHTPPALNTTEGTTEIELDREEYNSNNKIVLADSLCPKLNLLKVKVLKGNEPKEKSTRFTSPTIQKPEISIDKNLISIILCQTKYYSYLIKRQSDGKNTVIYDGVWQEQITDTPKIGCYTYSVTPYYFDGNINHYGTEIILPQVIIADKRDGKQLPNIVNKDWFNE